MAIATLNISLPESMKAEVEEIVAMDGFGNTSEFFRDLVREYLKERQQRRLEMLLFEGMSSGEPTPLTKSDLDDVRDRAVTRVKQRNSR